MKKIVLIPIILLISVCVSYRSQAQGFPVIDFASIGSALSSASTALEEAGKMTEGISKVFVESEKLYNETKRYYDDLKMVKNFFTTSRKVVECGEYLKDIIQSYNSGIQAVARDDNFTVLERVEIINDYKLLLEKSTNTLADLKKTALKEGELKLTDKERLDLLNEAHDKLFLLRGTVSYYTDKWQSVSCIRTEERGKYDMIYKLFSGDHRKKKI